MKIIAPITPHLSEELYSHSPNASKPSVFLDFWHRDVSTICVVQADAKAQWLDPRVKSEMDIILELRGHALELVGRARSAK